MTPARAISTRLEQETTHLSDGSVYVKLLSFVTLNTIALNFIEILTRTHFLTVYFSTNSFFYPIILTIRQQCRVGKTQLRSTHIFIHRILIDYQNVVTTLIICSPVDQSVLAGCWSKGQFRSPFLQNECTKS